MYILRTFERGGKGDDIGRFNTKNGQGDGEVEGFNIVEINFVSRDGDEGRIQGGIWKWGEGDGDIEEGFILFERMR